MRRSGRRRRTTRSFARLRNRAGSISPLRDRKSTRLNSSHITISTLSLHDALPIWALVKEGRELREQVTGLEAKIKGIESELREVLCTIPNMTHPDAPIGTTAQDNKVIRTFEEPRRFDFPVKRSEEHTSELQSHHDLDSFPTRRSSDLGLGQGRP